MSKYKIAIFENDPSWPFMQNIKNLKNDDLRKLSAEINLELCERHNAAARKEEKKIKIEFGKTYNSKDHQYMIPLYMHNGFVHFKKGTSWTIGDNPISICKDDEFINLIKIGEKMKIKIEQGKVYAGKTGGYRLVTSVENGVVNFKIGNYFGLELGTIGKCSEEEFLAWWR